MQITHTGGADVLKLRDVPEPTPGAGEVLIRVEAARVNFSDIMWRRDEYDVATPLPFIPGSEVAGTVPLLGRDGIRDERREIARSCAADRLWND